MILVLRVLSVLLGLYIIGPTIYAAFSRRKTVGRVNYDTVLLHLAGLTAAPAGHWSGDRAIPYKVPPLRSYLRRRRVGPPPSLER